MFKVMKRSFFSTFSRVDPFPQVFRQVKDILMLQLHEMIKAPHVAVCPIVFILFYGLE